MAIALGTGEVTEAQSAGDVWGASFAVVPTWASHDSVTKVLGANAVELQGWDLSVGIARGRPDSGDWGVSYVRKHIKRDSIIERDSGVYAVGDGVRLDGVEFRKAAVFGTIENRVQLGLEFGGGAGWAKGPATVEREEFIDCCPLVTETVVEPSTARAALALYDEVEIMPLYRLEFAAGVILTRGFKLRFTSGFDTFGWQPFRVGVVYLFGVD